MLKFAIVRRYESVKNSNSAQVWTCWQCVMLICIGFAKMINNHSQLSVLFEDSTSKCKIFELNSPNIF